MQRTLWPPGGAGRQQVFKAAIPASAFWAGALVRWYARAADAAGYESRFPATRQGQQYYGTVIAPPADEVITADVPILEW